MKVALVKDVLLPIALNVRHQCCQEFSVKSANLVMPLVISLATTTLAMKVAHLDTELMLANTLVSNALSQTVRVY